MIDVPHNRMVDFFKAISYIYGYSFEEYRYEVLTRRVQAHCLKLNIKSFEEYIHYILGDKTHFEQMFKYLSINVTEFFREEESLQVLKENVLLYLNSFFHIKIWVAGCSTGETAYSLAIVLDEMGLLHKSQIYATDFNKEVLKTAKEGRYSMDSLFLACDNYKRYGGKFQFENYINLHDQSFTLKQKIKERVLFFNHNLVCDSVMNEFQLILCQNVMIYFNDKLKERVSGVLKDSLCVNGFLVIGKNDYLEPHCLDDFRLYVENRKVYQKCK